jgi:hypothetical protein
MKLSKKYRERLLKYWFFVGVYAALWYTEWLHTLKGDFIWIVAFVIVPLSIAVYMTFILESLKIEKP